MSQTNVFILGAGITGCAAAKELQAHGIDYLVAEKNVEPGGLTRSISVGDAHFDYTGHFLHLARWSEPANIPYANQNNSDWQLVKRKSIVYIDGHIVPAPFQYNLYSLPEKLRSHCIQAYHTRPLIERPDSFKEYLLSGFGLGICEAFLYPYNEKLMGVPLNTLSVDAVKRFFPFPDKRRIEERYISGENSSDGYNSFFWYPKKSGIGLLAQGLSEGLKNLRTCDRVESVDLGRKLVHTSSGDITYNALINTASLKWFCSISDDPQLRELADSLAHNRVLCLNMLIHGALPEDFENCHWVYIPDKNIPFYRIGIYSNIPTMFWPNGHTGVYVEVAYPNSGALPSLQSIISKIFSSLENLKWTSRDQCVVLSANWIDCAYVHFDKKRQATLSQIIEILHSHDIHLAGRYGLWDYISMEDSIFSGIEVARALKS